MIDVTTLQTLQHIPFELLRWWAIFGVVSTIFYGLKWATRV